MPKDIHMTLGQKLKKLRKDRDLGQVELAKKLGASVVSISNYETDKTIPSSDTLIKIAKVFNITVDYLISGQPQDVIQIKNKELLKRVEQLDRLNPDALKSLIDMMDLVINTQRIKELSKAS
jgi:transcriptional regulator with XRE-family HTH domain